MRRRPLLRGALAALAAGCGPIGGTDAGPADAPRPPDGAVLWDAELELGEGEDALRPIADGDTLLLARGCQGSQHVWMALRARRLDPRGVFIRLALLRAADGAQVSVEFYVRLSFEPTGDALELRGLTLQVDVPDEAIGEDLILRGELVDRTGHGARAERRVQIAWGPEVCGA
jgi:hypothetical protein